ncbi:unnamed protein product, partial [Mesorhabditis spiculigera]
MIAALLGLVVALHVIASCSKKRTKKSESRRVHPVVEIKPRKYKLTPREESISQKHIVVSEHENRTTDDADFNWEEDLEVIKEKERRNAKKQRKSQASSVREAQE